MAVAEAEALRAGAEVAAVGMEAAAGWSPTRAAHRRWEAVAGVEALVGKAAVAEALEEEVVVAEVVVVVAVAGAAGARAARAEVRGVATAASVARRCWTSADHPCGRKGRGRAGTEAAGMASGSGPARVRCR